MIGIDAAIHENATTRVAFLLCGRVAGRLSSAEIGPKCGRMRRAELSRRNSLFFRLDEMRTGLYFV